MNWQEQKGLSAELRKSEESLRESHIRSKGLEDRLIERSVTLQAELNESKLEVESSVEALQDQLKETDENAQQEIKSLREALERRGAHMKRLQDEKEELHERTESMRVTIKALEEDRSIAVLRQDKEDLVSSKEEISLKLESCKG